MAVSVNYRGMPEAHSEVFNFNFNTWESDVPQVSHPDQALVPWMAAQMAINSMAEGWFTGKALSDYLMPADYVNARCIINSADHRSLCPGI